MRMVEDTAYTTGKMGRLTNRETGDPFLPFIGADLVQVNAEEVQLPLGVTPIIVDEVNISIETELLV